MPEAVKFGNGQQITMERGVNYLCTYCKSGHRGEKENGDTCMECGACARNCPTEAITVRAGVGCATAVFDDALGQKRWSFMP